MLEVVLLIVLHSCLGICKQTSCQFESAHNNRVLLLGEYYRSISPSVAAPVPIALVVRRPKDLDWARATLAASNLSEEDRAIIQWWLLSHEQQLSRPAVKAWIDGFDATRKLKSSLTYEMLPYALYEMAHRANSEWPVVELLGTRLDGAMAQMRHVTLVQLARNAPARLQRAIELATHGRPSKIFQVGNSFDGWKGMCRYADSRREVRNLIEVLQNRSSTKYAVLINVLREVLLGPEKSL